MMFFLFSSQKDDMMQPDITISIVNTNNRDMTIHCLESVFSTQGDLQIEVVVVNNACTDGSSDAIQKAYPQVKILENEKKLGFSTNNNLALNQACGRYLMLLNDDTIVQKNAFQTMVSFMDTHPEAGAIGANLLNPDLTFQFCFDYAPSPLYEGLRPFSERLRPLPQSHGRPLEVANVCGACMLVRSSVANRIGLLDTQFDPIYSEEVDWCHRITKAGWKIFHLPDARVIHIGSATMNKLSVRRYEQVFEKKALFFRKHYGLPSVLIYKLSLFANNFAKAGYWGILRLIGKSGADGEFQTHWNMARRALFL
jgi:GT2 family glycosyltransferase